MRKVILIDDNYNRGWREIFALIIADIYGNLVTFECLERLPGHNEASPFTNEQINQCYLDNPEAIFIQDNQLGPNVLTGLNWIQQYGKTHCIIMHTADGGDVGFRAAQYGAKMFMRKDDPERQMSNDTMQDMIIHFHNVIINHFKLAPELIWLVYLKMNKL